jgi:hypothetical protein
VAISPLIGDALNAGVRIGNMVIQSEKQGVAMAHHQQTLGSCLTHPSDVAPGRRLIQRVGNCLAGGSTGSITMFCLGLVRGLWNSLLLFLR